MWHGTDSEDGRTFAFEPAYREEHKYKYVINADGHTSAFRGERVFSSGATMLLVDGYCDPAEEPNEQNDVGECKNHHRGEWYYSLGLTPWKHYVPIRPDLSDLIEKTELLRQNDTLARQVPEDR